MKSGEHPLRLPRDVEERLDAVRRAMESYFGPDRRRIDHALRVAGYARDLLLEVDADPEVTLAAAYLHDIGIPEAEKRYGSSAGPYQERLGPPVARRLLEELGFAEPFITRVCLLVGHHHTPRGVEGTDFMVLWDADALVNLAEVVPATDHGRVVEILDRALVTAAGRRLAAGIFLPPESSR